MEAAISDKKSSRQILKSTFIMGGSSIINTLMGIVRTKVLALLLGPAGVGLTGIYTSVTNLVNTVSGFGISESGVRQIAAASGTGDQTIISRTVMTIRRIALLSGLAGMIFLLLFSNRISLLTFGSADHGFDLALLALMIFFGGVSAGQTALIQGMRQIGDLAKISVLAGFWGTLLSIPVIYFVRERGITLFLLIVSAMSILASWWYSRKIKTPRISISWRQSFSDAKPLLKLGSAFMFGSLMIVGTQYLLRVIVVRFLGINAAGIYQASATLSSVYVGIILKAMLTDFYPRLSAVAGNPVECNALVNKQVEVGLLLAVPGILGTMTFAPLVISAFYSSKFELAVGVLRWQILGVLLQVVSWPVGFILRAKGNGNLFFWTEVFANGTYLILSWLGIKYFGLAGMGMAFFGMNLLYWFLISWIVRRSYKVRLSTAIMQLFIGFAVATAVVFLMPLLLAKYYLIVNVAVVIVVGLFCLKTLLDGASTEAMPGFLVKIRARLSR